MHHGYDPTRPVRVDPATRPGQHAIVEQTMVKHLDADGNVVAYSWLSMAIEHADEIPFDTLHVATERKSAFELAQRRLPSVQRGSKATASVDLPEDVSLDVSRWRELQKQWDQP